MNTVIPLPGKPLPNGAEIIDDGVNFSLFSRNGTGVTLDIFENADDADPVYSYEFNPNINKTGDIWHVFLKGLGKGALYLYRVDGPFNPDSGHRFNKNQYLLDPYAKGLTDCSVFANLPPDYVTPVDKTDILLQEKRNAKGFPKCIVIDDQEFDWEGDRPLNYRLQKCVIYETHLKGFTADPSSGVNHPGTYLGMIEKIPYLRELGITSLELLPIHEFDEFENTNLNPKNGERLKNYWGYSTINFFSPKNSYASDRSPGGAVREFKTMVREMHKNGIEVILDVVFNHTAEGKSLSYCIPSSFSV
ncbi:MAG: glycogen debranching enzyme, partial [Treponemataceae bacterium]|nr:glycogen debranching enzyme [Treponemataceae bacterium]